MQKNESKVKRGMQNDQKGREIMPTKRDKLEQQAAEIVKMAEESGVQSNFLFSTTFDRYQTQLKILAELEQAINNGDALITKEYVKGRQNICINPAITEFNRTTDSANKTASTLIRLIKEFSVGNSDAEEDPLMKVINGEE